MLNASRYPKEYNPDEKGDSQTAIRDNIVYRQTARFGEYQHDADDKYNKGAYRYGQNYGQ